MGSVTIERRLSLWRDLRRSYLATIDGQEVGELGNGASDTYHLEPGLHDIRLKTDWCGSPTLAIDGAVDTKLVCQPSGSAFTTLPDILFRTGEYISLRRA